MALALLNGSRRHGLQERHQSDSHGLPHGECEIGKVSEIRLRAASAQMIPNSSRRIPLARSAGR
jgi:hypothetical protein